jgi:hypothetical protein
MKMLSNRSNFYCVGTSPNCNKNGKSDHLPVCKLQDLPDGVEEGVENQVEPDQPEQMVGHRQLQQQMVGHRHCNQYGSIWWDDDAMNMMKLKEVKEVLINIQIVNKMDEKTEC